MPEKIVPKSDAKKFFLLITKPQFYYKQEREKSQRNLTILKQNLQLENFGRKFVFFL